MAESLKADIEMQLKAMLHLPISGTFRNGNNASNFAEEGSGSYRKQRKPRRKKKKSFEDEAGASEPAGNSPQDVRYQENNSPAKRDNTGNQKQPNTPRQKKIEAMGEVNISEGFRQDELAVNNVVKIGALPNNNSVIITFGEQNTNQNSIVHDKGRRFNQDKRQERDSTLPKKDVKGSSEALAAEKISALAEPGVLEELALSGMFPLKRKSARFPRAIFFCRLCEFHCDRVENCWDHMKDWRHIRRLEISKGDQELKDLPEPSSAHIEALTKTVMGVSKTHRLSESAMEQRQTVVANLQQYLGTVIPNLKLKLYGSSVTGFALKTSDANVDIILPKGQSAAQALVTIYKSLKESDQYTNVRSDFKAKMPSVSVDDPQTQICYHMTVGNTHAQETTELLALYGKIDPRVRHLAVAFRFWAKVCKVDQQMMGTMPGYATTLMTVFYLQQVKPPVLPVLHAFSNAPRSTPRGSPTEVENAYCQNLDFLRIFWRCENTQPVGALWLGMVKFYSLTFSMTHDVVCIRQLKIMEKGQKKWSGKKLTVEDPFSRKRNVTRSVSSNLVFDYIYDCLRQAYRYFGTPQNSHKGCKKNGATNECLEDAPSSHFEATESKPLDSDHTDSLTFDDSGSSSTSSSNCQAADTSDNNVFQKFATNLSSSIIDNAKVSLLQNVSDIPSDGREVEAAAISAEEVCVENSESKSHSPRDSASCPDDENNDGDLNSEVLADRQADISAPVGDLSVDVIEKFAEQIVRAVIRKAIYRVIGTGGMTPANDGSKRIIGGVSDDEEDALEGKEEISFYKSPANNSVESGDDEQEDLESEHLSFTFSAETLTDGKGPAVVCSICLMEGHLKQACPEENLPDLSPLPEPTLDHLNMLSTFLDRVPEDFAPTPLEIKERNQIVSDLEKYIKGEYPAAKLSLFGSSCNGFGFRHSDLDICMTINQPTAEGLDCVEIIETLAKILKEHRGLNNVLPITTAKVPIAKFKHRQSHLEGDISLYNTLAKHNTDMLLMYSRIDKRVEILGYAMKVFAKVCDMGDASRGSLSSYAYILMVLYFLQQCKPPVIPVLQELHPPDEHPEVLVDGWNAWFFNDLTSLPKVWADHGKNRMSVAELWMRMFRFYTEEFEFREQVVCIRQHAPLTRFEKLWNGRCIAIEDPFDLSHNLGAGLSRRMNMYIQKAFIKGRALYCTPIQALPPGCHLGDYFFDVQRLTEEAPPTDKCCRACGKIGHFVKECPVVRNRKQREDEEKKKRRNYERSPGEDRGPHGRRDNRMPSRDNVGNSGGRRDYNRRQPQDHNRSPRADNRNVWPAMPYISPGLVPRSSSPRQSHNPPVHNRHQIEPHSPNSRWQQPMMPRAMFYLNQSSGSNSPSPSNQSYAPQMRGQPGAPYNQYSNSGAPYQQHYGNQGRHQESFHANQYSPREHNDWYDPRYGRKL